MLAPVLVTPPASGVYPVTLEEMKVHVGAFDFSDDDDLLTSYIEAATQHFDGYAGVLGRALITQTWRQDFDAFDCILRVPLRPVQSIASVAYYDSSNVLQTLATSVYTLFNDAIGSYVDTQAAQSWPSAYVRQDAVRVTYVAGYGDNPGDVPAPIRHAIMLLAAHWYENREAVSDKALQKIPLGVDALIAPLRAVGF